MLMPVTSTKRICSRNHHQLEQVVEDEAVVQERLVTCHSNSCMVKSLLGQRYLTQRRKGQRRPKKNGKTAVPGCSMVAQASSL